MKKLYFLLTLTQESPLRLSNGDALNTDSDLLTDGGGLPFIPGTGLAGMLRAELNNNDAEKALFGYVEKKNGHAQRSGVLISDAVPDLSVPEKDAFIKISQRDGVGIDLEYGVADDRMKYDFEIVETNHPYRAVIELDEDDKPINEKEIPYTKEMVLRSLLTQIVRKGLHMGCRKTRGYGLMKAKVEECSFTFPADAVKWLSFKPFAPATVYTAFTESEEAAGLLYSNGKTEYKIAFKIPGNMLVGVPVTEAAPNENESAPDTRVLRNAVKKPVIPGTSWAGSIRHAMHAIAQEAMTEEQYKINKTRIDSLFGIEQERYKKSRITFTESEIDGGASMLYSRNAIERFTGGPANTALFTLEMWHGGEGSETITLVEGCDELILSIFEAALRDLSNGFVTLGSDAGIGYGIVSVTEIQKNSEPFQINQPEGSEQSV